MDGLRILVTGSTGFVGSHLVRELLGRGHKVRAFHRPTSALRLLEGLDVEHFQGDLTQPETVRAAVEGMEIVFHAAAWMGGHDPTGQQYAVTVEGTRNLLHCARQVGVRRVIHTSSVAALGIPNTDAQGLPTLIDEHHTWNYRADYYPYGYAKYLAELEVQKAVAHGLDAVIVNPTVVFGAGDIYRQAGSVITQVAEHRLTFATEGGINCVHIDDVTDGHLAAMACGRTGERYILGGENMTHLQLVQTIAQAARMPSPRIVLPARVLRWMASPAQAFRSFLDLPFPAELFRLAGFYFYYDLKKSADELGLANHRPVADAIAEAIEWLHLGQSKPIETAS